MDQDLATILAAGGVAVTLLTTMVIGGTELVKRIFDGDKRGAAIIGVAVVIGALGGLFLFEAVGLALGIVVGLSAVGIHNTVQSFGSGTSSTPRELTSRK